VKLVWRDFDYYGPDSTLASQAAYAAGEQGKFWQFYDLLYSNQKSPNSGWASSSNLEKFAQSLNLNMVEFNQWFNSTKYSSLIQSNYSAGQSLGVSGTPTFFVVGPTGKIVQITGAQPYSVFASAVSSVSSG
jgi:protein-disulfide isomerase